MERTMWCPKRCDLLVMETKSNPHELKWNLKVIIFCVLQNFVFHTLSYDEVLNLGTTYSLNTVDAGWNTGRTGWNASASEGETLIRSMVQVKF